MCSANGALQNCGGVHTNTVRNAVATIYYQSRLDSISFIYFHAGKGAVVLVHNVLSSISIFWALTQHTKGVLSCCPAPVYWTQSNTAPCQRLSSSGKTSTHIYINFIESSIVRRFAVPHRLVCRLPPWGHRDGIASDARDSTCDTRTRATSNV